jgi:hypothetical protein
LIIDADAVLAAVQTVTCANTTSTSCVAAFTAQRRRALAQTATITIRRALASIELVSAVPALSAADLAAALNVDVSAIGGPTREFLPPAITSFRISVMLNTVGDQDEARLLQAIGIIFGVDSSTLSVTATSQFPPSPPSPVAPTEPVTNLFALTDDEARKAPPVWLFVVLGVAAALLAALACVCYVCLKRHRFRVQASKRRSSYLDDPTPEESDDPMPEESACTPEVLSSEVASKPDVLSLDHMSTPGVSAPSGSVLSSKLLGRIRVDPTAGDAPALMNLTAREVLSQVRANPRPAWLAPRADPVLSPVVDLSPATETVPVTNLDV